MQGTLATLKFSRLAAVVRRLAMPTLILTVAACDDAPTEPAQAREPHWPSWSPNGKQLAYERQAGSQHNIWVVTLADGSTAPLITSRLDDTTPNWSR